MTMHSLILRTASELLVPLLLLFSIFLLLRGHNEPGGGFVGGLVAGTSFSLLAIAYGAEVARRALHVEPHLFLGLGLSAAIASALIGLIVGDPLLTAEWVQISAPWGELTLGTTLLFDTGVYLVVFGTTVITILTLVDQ